MIVAHRLSTVKNADQIIVLKHGQIVEQGNHRELVERKADYYNLVKVGDGKLNIKNGSILLSPIYIAHILHEKTKTTENQKINSRFKYPRRDLNPYAQMGTGF